MSPTEQYENQLNSRLTLGACATSTVWAAAGTALAPPSICLAAIAAAWASICCNTRLRNFSGRSSRLQLQFGPNVVSILSPRRTASDRSS